MQSNDLSTLFLQRQSVRAYDSSRAVEKEKLMRCIEAARLAPSACNSQPWKYIVIDDAELKNKVAEHVASKALSMNHFSYQAPILVAVVRERANFTATIGRFVKRREFPLMDIGISAIQFCLQATTENLGTCMVGWFSEGKIKKLLNIPRSKRLELIITVGYPAIGEIREKRRKPTDEILSFNTYR